MKLAFLFPGQGSQSVGMGSDIYTHYPAAASTLDEIDDLLGYKQTTLCFYGPEESLRETNVTQPALYSVSVATLQVLDKHGIKPQAVAGHSIGEYAALVAAGALDWQIGLTLVSERATAMHQASEVNPGAMAAVLGLSADVVQAVCAETQSAGHGVVAAANFNGAGQVVISGETAGVNAAMELAKQRGARRVLLIPVGGGFHSPLMSGAADTMRAFIKDAAIGNAKLPVVANVTGDYETSAEQIKDNLAAQIDHPVLWEQSVNRLLADGFDTFVEVGSGSVLTGILKRMAKENGRELALYTTQDAASLQATVAALGNSATT